MPTKKTDKNGKDRETYGAGYEKSLDDLNVIGQNEAAKQHNRNDQKRQK